MLTEKHVSIVIATRNRCHTLCKTLQQLAELHPYNPVIVVDNGSEDKTAETVRNLFPYVKLIALKENKGTGARTIGVEVAETPLIAFNDDDSLWEKDALAKASALFTRRSKLGLIAAHVLVGTDKKTDPVSIAMKDSPLKKFYTDAGGDNGIPVLGFLSCGSIVRKAAFTDVNGFEEKFGIGGEEQLLAIDLTSKGWEVCYFDNIIAYHYPEQNNNNRTDRKWIQIRNDLWTTWLRRPYSIVFKKTSTLLKSSTSEPLCKKALLEALKGLPWVLRKRQVIPDNIEKALQLLRQ